MFKQYVKCFNLEQKTCLGEYQKYKIYKRQETNNQKVLKLYYKDLKIHLTKKMQI